MKKTFSATEKQHRTQSDAASSEETGDLDDNSDAESNKEQEKNKVTVCFEQGLLHLMADIENKQG